MVSNCLLSCAAVFLTAVAPVVADQHTEHTHGPTGGYLVRLGESGTLVELSVQEGQTVTARLLNKEQQPIRIDAAAITFTFTEPDGEKEDYSIDAAADDKGSVFRKKSSHVAHHVVRDKMSITVNMGGRKLTSKTFAYPHGPHGGELVALGRNRFYAELVIDGDVVRVHMLNGGKRPVSTDAKVITLTFTEPDGEVEDYEIPMGKSSGKGTIYEVDDDHIVKHVKRDKMSVRLAVGESSLKSSEFRYPKQ